MDTFEKVKEIVVTNLGCEEDKVTEAALIADDLGADSLAMVELIMELEDTFGITIPEEKSKDIKTIGDVVKLIDSGEA